ncbi:MAG: iron ABC transporter permease, partial [Gammaproteobacteria bacterium]|nr:iron ABC transporter permease [Gammaproteobacteria bacterium]
MVNALRNTLSNARKGFWATWQQLSLPIVALIICLPLIVVGVSFFIGLAGEEQRATLAHLFDNVIGEYVRHSVALMVGVGLLVLVMGVTAAWLTTACEFPGVKWLRWALLLPLAMPA